MKRILVFFAVLLLINMNSCGDNNRLSLVCDKDSVDSFLDAAGNIYGEGLLSGMSFTEENIYNVTPKEVSDVTDIKIFKASDSCASYVLIDDGIYPICEYFGGYGFVNAVPCDFDGDGNIDLLVASSWGSGLHRSVISVFNTVTKESTVIYDTSDTDAPEIDLFVAAKKFLSLKSDSELPVCYDVYSVDINADHNNMADLSGEMIEIVGTVVYEDGVIVFKPNAVATTSPSDS